MQRKFAFIVGAAALVFAVSCSTDVDVNGPYSSQTVIYGILDPALDTQFVRINKTWLGDGNNFDHALVRDSSEYPTGAFEGRVDVMNGLNVVSSFPLEEIELDNKSDDGIFFAPEHKAYFFPTPNGLDANRDYRLVLEFPDRTVESETDLVGVPLGAIQFPPAGNQTFNLNWASVNLAGNPTYFNQTFRWTSAQGARRYEASLLVYFTELLYTDASHTTLVSETPRVLEWKLGNVITNQTLGGETINLPASGEAFYNFLASRLTPDNRVRREFGIWDPVLQHPKCFDFVLTIANDEFNTYLDVNQPVTTIVQERPAYTNVVNGLGIWASRANDRVNGVGITEGAMKELVQGNITNALNFCSSNPFNEFYCGD